jgi:gas vesicle protein
MNIGELIFGLKDVIAIIGGVGSLTGLYYVLKNGVYRAEEKALTAIETIQNMRRDFDDKIIHLKNGKQASIKVLTEDLGEVKQTIKEKEIQIYTKIDQVRDEQKDAHDKLSNKLDTVVSTLGTMSVNIAEMNGYLKAKKETGL